MVTKDLLEVVREGWTHCYTPGLIGATLQGPTLTSQVNGARRIQGLPSLHDLISIRGKHELSRLTAGRSGLGDEP